MKKRKRKNMRMTLFFNGPTFNMYLYHLFFSLFPACASETLILRRWGAQKAQAALCLVAEAHYSLKQNDCVGIHLMLSIV